MLLYKKKIEIEQMFNKILNYLYILLFFKNKMCIYYLIIILLNKEIVVKYKKSIKLLDKINICIINKY